MSLPWWVPVRGPHLAQGDLLPDCLLPVFVSHVLSDASEKNREGLQSARLIVLTQSCDLVNNKTQHVALCPIHTLPELEAVNPGFRRKAAWENVRKGRVEGLQLLASPEYPADNRAALAVDFGQIVSLPLDYLESHAESLGDRWRLDSPFLEHFSQAFARFFMRVGLPAGLEPYK